MERTFDESLGRWVFWVSGFSSATGLLWPVCLLAGASCMGLGGHEAHRANLWEWEAVGLGKTRQLRDKSPAGSYIWSKEGWRPLAIKEAGRCAR